jgi:hypothetical protein
MVGLVSASAVTRKTEALRQARKMITGLPLGEANILPQKTSPQELLASLHLTDPHDVTKWRVDPITGHPYPHCGLIYAGEMAGFFSREGFNDQMATQVTELNDAFIGPYPVRFRSWNATLFSPCVGMMTATTPTGIATELPAFVRTAGFFGRIIWVYEEMTDRVAPMIGDEDPADAAREQVLRAGVVRMAQLRGPVGWSAEAFRAFQTWYGEHHHLAQMSGKHAALVDTGYWGRKDDQVLRVMMVLMACEGDRLVLSTAHLDEAIGMLKRNESDFGSVMGEIATNASAQYAQRVLVVLRKREGKDMGEGAGWVERSWLLRQLYRHGGTWDLEKAGNTLKDAKLVEEQLTGRGKVWWKARVLLGGQLRAVQEQRDGQGGEGRDDG